MTTQISKPKARNVNLSADIWNDDNKLRRAFSWLTRIGVAPKFGTLPIHYYQQDQCKAIDAIVDAAANFGLGVNFLKCSRGIIFAYGAYPAEVSRRRWHRIAFISCGQVCHCEPSAKIKSYLKSISLNP